MSKKSNYSIEEIRDMLVKYSRMSQDVINQQMIMEAQQGNGAVNAQHICNMLNAQLLEKLVSRLDDEELFDVLQDTREDNISIDGKKQTGKFSKADEEYFNNLFHGFSMIIEAIEKSRKQQ